MNGYGIKRKSSQKHAKREHLCPCGRVLRGNGGWSSHKKTCPTQLAYRKRAEYRPEKLGITERRPSLYPQLSHANSILSQYSAEETKAAEQRKRECEEKV